MKPAQRKQDLLCLSCRMLLGGTAPLLDIVAPESDCHDAFTC
jgi:hypothetical protein